MDTKILDLMINELHLLNKEKNVMNSNLYYILKVKWPNAEDVVRSSEDHVYSHIGYERIYRNLSYSALQIYKYTYVNHKYTTMTSMQDRFRTVKEAGLVIDVNNMDIDKMVDACGLVFAIDKLMISRLCKDIAEIIVREIDVSKEMFMSSIKFLQGFLEFIVEYHNYEDYKERFISRYRDGITGFELFLISEMFKIVKNLKLFNTDESMLDLLRGGPFYDLDQHNISSQESSLPEPEMSDDE